jgi:DNA primase
VPLIARASIDQVQAAADMVEIVGQYTELRKAGANYSGRCPFHEERTPSFSVNPAEKLYYCFGCGVGGNLFGFVQAKENLDFAGAVEYLADRYGIELEYEETSARGDAERHRRERLRALLEQATAYYERVLHDAGAAALAREYLKQRGLGDDVCRQFRLGFSLAGWDKLREAARAKKFSDQDLLDAGLVVPGKSGRPYDRFRGRIMFPLADDRGRTLGFGARTMGDEKPKYLNSPETPLYHKSEAVFGLHAAKAAAGREDRVYVVEGYTDVLALVQAGVHNVVASMGTALTEQQLKRIKPLTENVYLCLDADAAGMGAMKRALTVTRALELDARIVRLPTGMDPADFVLSSESKDAFLRLAAEAETLLQFLVRTTLASGDISTARGRSLVIEELQTTLATASGPEFDEEVRRTADALSLSRDHLVDLLRKWEPRRRQRARVATAKVIHAPEGGSGASERTPQVFGGSHELEVRFLAGCLAQPQKGRAVLAGVDESFFATAETRAALRVVKARLEREGAGNTLQTAAKAADEGDDGEVLAEVVVRAGRERFTATVVDELFLRVQEAHVSRRIARLKVTAKTDESGKQGAELIRLQAVRRTVREAIRTIPVDEEPDEG